MRRTGNRAILQTARWKLTVAIATVVTTFVVGAGAVIAAPASAAATPICASAKHPRAAANMSTAIARTVAERPHSVVGLAAWDPALGVTCVLHGTSSFYSASIVKVSILSALLLKIGGVGHLTTKQRSLAYAMITQSSNSAATTLWNEVGMASMQNFLNKAGMSHTVLSTAWGLTTTTPDDQLTLLHMLSIPGKVLGKYAQEYVLSLMAAVIPSQRWGVSAGMPSNVTLHIKNGWLGYPNSNDWNINSLGVFTGKNIDYQMAILTKPPRGGQSESYGIQTVQDVATIVNKNLAGLYAIFG